MNHRSDRKSSQVSGPGQTKPGWSARRVAALVSIILLVAMYVVTLFVAIFDSSSAGRMFRLCLGLTVAIPVFLWIFIWCIGVLEHRKTIASMEILNSNPDERRKMEEELQSAAEKKQERNHSGQT